MAEQKHRGPMGGGPRGMMPGEKAKDFKGTMGKLISYLGKYLPAIIAVMLFAIASTVFSIIGPKILGNATTELFNGIIAQLTGTGGIDFEAVARILLFLGIIYLVSAVLSYIQGFIMTKVSTQISYGMRRDISQKINRMPLAYFDRVPNGEVLSRITNDVDTVTQTLNQSMTQIVTSVTQFIGVLVMMLTISPLMTLVALCILPLSLIIVSNVVKRSQPFFQKQQAYLGHANGHVEEMYGGHLVVTAFNGEEKSIKTFNEINDNLYNSAWKSQFLSGMMMPLMNFVGNLGYVAVCVLGSALAMSGQISFGVIVAFILYVRLLSSPLTQIAQGLTNMQTAAASAHRNSVIPVGNLENRARVIIHAAHERSVEPDFFKTASPDRAENIDKIFSRFGTNGTGFFQRSLFVFAPETFRKLDELFCAVRAERLRKLLFYAVRADFVQLVQSYKHLVEILFAKAASKSKRL